MKHNIIGTLYDAAQDKIWLGVNDYVYRWQLESLHDVEN